MWVQGKMVLKHKVFKSIHFHVQILNYEVSVYELKNHVEEKILNLQVGLQKKLLL
jgi:hypothetical protein